MSTYNELMHKYAKTFSEKGLSSDTLKVFLFELCNEYDVDLYMDLDKEAIKEIEDKFEKGVKRLYDEEPLNYVLGYSYFYGYKMETNPNVLIPRYETEELVGLILSKYDEFFKGQKVTLCDIGTGSGAIAIALKKEEPNLEVYASDISHEALEVAKRNAKNNDAEVTFFEGSMLEPMIKNNIKVDILVSNPPYIKETEEIESAVYDFEPHVALFGGEDGLKFYREIFEKANLILKDKFMMFFEMGYDQKENLTKLAKQYFKNVNIQVYKDINKKDRMLMIENVSQN